MEDFLMLYDFKDILSMGKQMLPHKTVYSINDIDKIRIVKREILFKRINFGIFKYRYSKVNGLEKWNENEHSWEKIR